MIVDQHFRWFSSLTDFPRMRCAPLLLHTNSLLSRSPVASTVLTHLRLCIRLHLVSAFREWALRSITATPPLERVSAG